jgi:hypothetical protein
MADPITKSEMAQLLKEHAKDIGRIIGGGGSGPSPSPSDGVAREARSMTDNLSEINKTFNPLSAGFNLIKDASGYVAKGFGTIYEATSEQISVMQDLSKSGINFSGDIVGMSASIKGMRISNEEFSDLMKKNSAGFTALAGNSTRGAEAFAKLAKEFQASEFTDGLVAAGISNKEMNEILAMEMTTKKMAIRDDKESRRASIESAAALAKEMDMMAKLTGKTREEQMASMQKVKDDMAIEAKIRQQTAGMNEKDAAEYRKKVIEQMARAEQEGRGQLLKETFLYGQAVSKEAAQQQISLGNQAFQNTVSQGRALMQGQFKEAEEQGKAARRGLVDFQNSAEGLQLALLPGQNAFTEDTHKMMKSTQAYRDALAAIQQEEAFRGKSTAELEKEAERRAKEAQDLKNKEGKEVGQTTEAMVKLEQRTKGVESAFYNNLIVPLERDLKPTIKTMSDQFLKSQINIPGRAKPVPFEEAIGESMQTAYESEKRVNRAAMTREQRVEYEVRLQQDMRKGTGHLGETASGAIGTTIQAIGEGAAKSQKAIKDGVTEAVEAVRKTPAGRREFGSIGAANKLFEDFGQGTLMELHGKETVLTENQFKDLAKGIRSTSLSEFAQNQSDKSSSKSAVKDMMDMMKSSSGLSDIQNVDRMFKEKFLTGSISSKENAQTTATQLGTGQIFQEVMEKNKAQTKESMGAMTLDKKATLDDVVTSLNNLNIKMAQLLETNLDIGSKQIRATRSNSRNLFERA